VTFAPLCGYPDFRESAYSYTCKLTDAQAAGSGNTLAAHAYRFSATLPHARFAAEKDEDQPGLYESRSLSSRGRGHRNSSSLCWNGNPEGSALGYERWLNPELLCRGSAWMKGGKGDSSARSAWPECMSMKPWSKPGKTPASRFEEHSSDKKIKTWE